MQKTQNNFSIIQRWDGVSREEKTGIVLLIVALFLGAFVRLIHVGNTSFPINDGGLFYAMTRDLQVNHFLIPAVTSYNNSGLPFAYPPLGFFMAGGLNSVFGWDLLDLMRWLPLIFNLLCIPVFYHFAKQLLRDPVKGGVAVLFFALLKPGYEWLIMGGGLTRSPAMLFSLLTLDCYLALIESEDKRPGRIFLTAFFYSLTFLSHLEIGWFTTYSLTLLWIFKGRSKKNFIASVFITVGTLILTSPYWIAVIHQNNLQPFVNVMTSGGYDPRIILYGFIYFLNFTEELLFPVLGAIALIGLIVAIKKRDYLLPVWLVLNIFLDARNINRSDVIPAAMLISMGVVDGIYLLIKKKEGKAADEDESESGRGFFFTRTGLTVIFILCIHIILALFLTRSLEPSLNYVLSPGNRDAMEWVRQNTPSTSRFISIPSSTWWETDAVGEWFPALSGRKNALTVQGSEWLPGYRQRITEFKEISAQITSGSFNIQELMQSHPGVNFLYLPLSLYRDTAELGGLRTALSEFPLVFSNPDVEIYQLRGN